MEGIQLEASLGLALKPSDYPAEHPHLEVQVPAVLPQNYFLLKSLELLERQQLHLLLQVVNFELPRSDHNPVHSLLLVDLLPQWPFDWP